MRFPNCLSTSSTDSEAARHTPLLPSSSSVSGDRRQSGPHTETSNAAAASGTWSKPGCIFCDVSKEKGFGVIYEDEALIAFHDRTPRARVHLLIIPRYHVAESVKALDKSHLPLLDRMIALGHTLSNSLDPSTPPKLGFHIPPFSSVPHLHLHVLIPPYTFLGRLKYPVSHRHRPLGGNHSNETAGESRKGTGSKVKGWSWFVEAEQAREILSNGGSVKIGRS